jgi:hypothetical protein
MHDVSGIAGMGLIALSSLIVHLPVGPRRVRGLIGTIVALCAAGPIYFWTVRAPIGPTLEFVLGIGCASILIVFGCRDFHAGSPRRPPREG